MKHALKCVLVAVAGVIALVFFGTRFDGTVTFAQEAKTMPEVIILGKDAKLGQVTFSHASHNNGTYTVGGNPIACTTCHHTAQPLAEASKNPLHKTVWPADRTTTLTLDLFKKDAVAAGVAACRDCHAKTGEKPKLLPAIPQIKSETSGDMLAINNQQAFHRTCTGCHVEVKKTKADSKAPTAAQCTLCHKKAAA
jgi:class III cytochrome C family protein